jgi:hypothetical protein
MRNCTYKLDQGNGTFIEFETEEQLLEYLENYQQDSFEQSDVEIPNEELSKSYRPTSALITTSNEINKESGKGDKGEVVKTMNLVLKNYATEPLPYSKGKLISRFKLFKDIGVDVNKVNEYMANYWSSLNGRTPTSVDIQKAISEMPAFLGTTAFQDTVEMSALVWLFSDKITESNINHYGENITKENKFDMVCGRTYALVFTKEDGSLGTFNKQGFASEKGSVLAWQVPNITKTENGYIFDNVQVSDLESIQGELESMYEIQESFKDNQNKEIPTNNMMISKGARIKDKTDKVRLTEDIIIDSNKRSKNKGKIQTTTGARVYTEKISPEDAVELARLRIPKGYYKNDAAKKYFNQMVFIKKEDEKRIFDELYKEIENGELTENQAINKLADILKTYHYNIPLDNQINIIKYEDGFKPVSTITRKAHLGRVAFTMKSDFIDGVNKKIYFSFAKELPLDTTEEEEEAPRLRSDNPSSVTAQQETRAMEWFKNSFLSNGINLNLAFTNNPKAFADFTNTAITLYRGANYTHLYHEAFHRFTQHFLSPQERTVLYEAVKSLISDKSLAPSENLKFEEALAEGFRSYMLSGGKTININVNGKDITINTVKPLEAQKPIVSWYQKIFNFFKSLFNNKTNYFQDYNSNNTLSDQQNKTKEAEDLITRYFKEASNPRQNRTNLFLENPANAPYRTLNSSRTFFYKSKDDEAKTITLDSTAMYELQQGIDALFVEAFKEVYKNDSIALLGFQDEKEKKAVVNFIYKKVYKKIQNAAKDTTTDDLNIILDNFNNIIKETSGFRKEFSDLYKEEELVNSDTYRLKTAEEFEKKSQLELSSSIIINLLSNLPAINKKGKVMKSKTWGLPLMTDFASNWSVLQRNISGKKYPEMLKQIEELSETTHPQFKLLLETLPDPTKLDSKIGSLNLMTLFEQTFSLPRVNTLVSYVEEYEGKLIIKPTEAGSKVIKQVINKWKNNASEVNIPKVAALIEEVDKALAFNTEAIKKSITTETKKQIDENYNIIFDFLKQIGINYSDLSLDYARGLNWNEKDFLQYTGYIVDAIEKYSKHESKGNLVEMLDKKQVFKSVTGKSIEVKREHTALEELANLEVLLNETLNDDMIMRPDGNAEWRYRQYNYVSKFIDDIKLMPYETVKSIYPALDVVKNPGIQYSPLFKSLFWNNNGKYERNKDFNFEVFSNSGVEDIDQKLGFVVTDMSNPDKLLTDFYNFLITGKEEFTRFGDKSTAFGVNTPTTEKRLLTIDNYEMNRQFFDLLATELTNYRHHEHFEKHESTKFPKSAKQNIHKKQAFIIFDEILQDENLKKEILNSDVIKNDRGFTSFGEELDIKIEEALNNYFNNLAIDYKAAITSVLPSSRTESDLLINDITKEGENLDQLIQRYLKLSTANRIDHFNLMFGDLRNYKNGSDVFKRLSQFSATGLFPSLIDGALDKLQERSIESLFNENQRTVDDKFTFVQFNNVPVNLPKMLVESVENEKERKALADYINLDGKDKGDRTDAQGAVTLDFYRLMNNLIGKWDVSQEDAYKAQVEFVKAKQQYNKTDQEYIDAFEKASNLASDLLIVWNPKKWQYAGSILSEHTIAKHFDVRAFLKFSLAPLIPTVMEGKPIEAIAENMYKSGTDLYTFSSGNKNSIDQENQDFQDWNNKDKAQFNPSVLSLHSFKEQLPVDNKMKEDAIFASQMRALMSSGLFENGEPVEGRDLTSYNQYKESINNLSQLAQIEMEYRFSSTDKIVEYLEKEFDKRDMPYHIKDFIKMYKDNPVYTFDTSFQSFYVMNTLFSLVTRNLVKQSYPGGQFIQVSDLGYTNATFKDVAKYSNEDLEFYPLQEDGSSGKAEIKIAFSNKYKSLLNIKYNGVKIGTLEKLNQLLKDKEFVALHGDKITMTACRIPVQSFSTIESFIVKEFLPEEAGQIVIVPPGLTIKTGSDFDIDKLNIYEPTLNENGDLVSTKGIKDIVSTYRETLNNIDEYKKLIKDTIQQNKELAASAKELASEADNMEIEEPEEITDFSFLAGDLEGLKSRFMPANEKRSKLLLAVDNLNKTIEEKRKVFNKNIELLKESREILEDEQNYLKQLHSSQLNTLINSMSDIILDKDNRTNLLTPNEIKELDELFIKKGLGKKGEEVLSLGQTVNVLISAKVRENNFSAKDSLGIAAKANKTFALFQEAGLQLSEPTTTALLNDNNGVMGNSFTEEYKGFYPMYDTNNNIVEFENFKEGLDKRQILSQFVSGTVDVANDARIGSINFNTKTAPVYIHGILKNIHLFDLAAIMTHPAVIELTKELEKRDSFYYKFFASREKDRERRKNLLSKSIAKSEALSKILPQEFFVLKEGEFNLYKTAEAILKTKKLVLFDKKGKKYTHDVLFGQEETKDDIIYTSKKGMKFYQNKESGKIRFNVEKYPIYAESFEFTEAPLDARILAEYLLLEKESKATNSLIKAISWDTDTPKSFAEYAYYDKMMEEASYHFNYKNLQKLKNGTITSSLNVTDFVNEKFKPLFGFVNKPIFIDNLLGLYNETFGKSLGDFARDYTNDLFTYIYQNNGMYYEDLIVNKKVFDLKNPDNLENRLKQLKTKFKGTDLSNNYFLNQLDFKKSPSKSNYIYPKLSTQILNSQQGNVYHEQLMKLLYPEYSTDPTLNLELKQWAFDLIRATLSFNGSARMQGSIIDLLPQEELEDYSEIIYEAFTNTNEYEQIDFTEFNALFKNNKSTKYFTSVANFQKKDPIHTAKYYVRGKEVDSTPKVTQSNAITTTDVKQPMSKEKPKRFIKSPETTSRIMKGSVIEYKNAEGTNKWLVWNITEQDKLQLIGLDGSKFSGTPNKDSKNITKILGAYNTTVDKSTGVDVIVTDNNNIYSTATGKKLHEGKDGSSLKKRNDILNSLQTDENDVSLSDLGLNEDLNQEDFKCNKNEL